MRIYITKRKQLASRYAAWLAPIIFSRQEARKQDTHTPLAKGGPFQNSTRCLLPYPPPFCPNSSFHHAKPHQHQLQHHARRARARATHLVVVDVGPAHQCRQAPVDDVPAARPDEPISAASQWKRQLRESTPPTHTFFARSVLRGGGDLPGRERKSEGEMRRPS